jgi:HK97 family phage major capsid protein
MAYNNIISRSDAQATMPEDVSSVVMTNIVRQSAALQLFRNVPMSRAQQRIPVISALPVAYWVSPSDVGLKQTTEVDWTNKYLNAEELATIVPIPEAVLDDAGFDIWQAIRPLLEESIGRALDAAIFFGTNKPASFPSDIVTTAIAAGNSVTRGTNNAAAGGIAGDISDVNGLVEADGYDVTGYVGVTSMKGRLRQARSTLGTRLAEVSPTEIDGTAISYPMRGLWPTGSGATDLVAGDFSQGLIGIRQDLTYKVLDQAVIQDDSGLIQFNLAQQDMVALRVVARFAFVVPNAISYEQPTEANRWPFAVLRES